MKVFPFHLSNRNGNDLQGGPRMDRQAKLRETHARCLVTASELPSEEMDAKDLLVRVARTVEAQMEGMQDFDVTPGAPGERMQGVPAISGQPAQGSMLDGSQGPQLTPEQYKAVIQLRIEIGLPPDPEEREQVKNNYVAGLFKAIEGSGGSIVGHDVKMQPPKGAGGQ
jgi:hypothetical protein